MKTMQDSFRVVKINKKWYFRGIEDGEQKLSPSFETHEEAENGLDSYLSPKEKVKTHTKGEWNYFSSDNETYAVTNGDNVITISGEEHNPDNEANAKLITAAPEMLEVLIIVKEHLEKMNDGHCDHRITEAIKKATE